MELTRRRFLETSSSALAALGTAPLGLASLGLPRSRAAVAPGRVLVLVFLRGGADGLNLIVPHGEPAYYRLRERLAIPRPGEENGALDLDGTFGLNPWARALLPHFEAGTGVALHAVGRAGSTRSHFEEQDVWETGVVEDTQGADGWLNRHLQTSAGHGPVRAVSFGESLPRYLRGDEEVFAVRALDELAEGAEASRSGALSALASAYAGGAGNPQVERGGRAALDALRQLEQVARAPYSSQVEYPDDAFARRLRDVARTVRAGVGLEVAGVDLGGWDTHQDQGGAAGGVHSQLVRRLSDGLDAFLRDLEDRSSDVLVLVVSEFGRTAARNGSGGTDHGWANCVLAFGGPVLAAGGGIPRKLVGQWPGLEPGQLHEDRDLMHTTDFRDVLAEVASAHLGNDALEAVLPGHEPRPVGLL